MATDIGVQTLVDTGNNFDHEYNCDNNSPGGVGLGDPVVVPVKVFLSMTKSLQHVVHTLNWPSLGLILAF